MIQDTYKVFEFDPPNAKSYKVEEAELYKDLHAKYVFNGFTRLSRGMQGLDSGQPWFLYWLTQALECLNVEGYELDDDMKKRCVSYLR